MKQAKLDNVVIGYNKIKVPKIDFNYIAEYGQKIINRNVKRTKQTIQVPLTNDS
ncbi:MAG: hypothetical protein LBT02_00925 [Rickettsiales bacterium]|jgi:hypothetical protein|nr:hypothetical protein [Rickettsiales bacterium]